VNIDASIEKKKMRRNLFISYLVLAMMLNYQICMEKSESEPATLQQLSTIYGGCNDWRPDSRLARETQPVSDTLYWKIESDTLHLHIGINYICCAPFLLTCSQNADDLEVTLNDTCAAPYDSCYCRCMCFYEFETLFSNFQGDKYKLKIYLHDPRQTQDSLLWDIRIP